MSSPSCSTAVSILAFLLQSACNAPLPAGKNLANRRTTTFESSIILKDRVSLSTHLKRFIASSRCPGRGVRGMRGAGKMLQALHVPKVWSPFFRQRATRACHVHNPPESAVLTVRRTNEVQERDLILVLLRWASEDYARKMEAASKHCTKNTLEAKPTAPEVAKVFPSISRKKPRPRRGARRSGARAWADQGSPKRAPLSCEPSSG